MNIARQLYGKKIELVLDGTIEDIAKVNRARTQKIRSVRLIYGGLLSLLLYKSLCKLCLG